MAEPIRGRVSPYTFLGRFQPQQQQQQVENAETNIALRRNQFAIANVNSSLVRISEQINVLSASLQGISTQIKETSTLETLKEQQKARQEKVLAEQQIREGKESQIERKIQEALVTPIKKIGAKAQGTLFNLTRFFNILLGGFLLNRILDSVAKLSKDGKFSLKNLGDAIVKDLGIVGGIFLAINGGFALALNSVVRLAALITKIAIKGLILAPIKLAFGVAKTVLTTLANSIRNIPRVPRAPAPPAPPRTGGGSAAPPRTGGGGGAAPPTAAPRAPLGGVGRSLRGFFGRTLGGAIPAAALQFLLGGTAGESVTGGLAFALPFAFGMTGPLGWATALAASFAAGNAYQQFKPQIEQALPGAGFTMNDIFGIFTSNAGGDRSLNAQQQGSDVSVIDATGGGGGGGEVQEVPSALSDATYLPQITSSNPSNFYLLYSKIQYNVVG